MANNQPELPKTRREDEPAPPAAKRIGALDDACAELEKAKGKAINAAQAVVEKKQTCDALLRKHKISSYVYTTANSVEKKVFISEGIKTAKIKKAKADEGADE